MNQLTNEQIQALRAESKAQWAKECRKANTEAAALLLMLAAFAALVYISVR